MTLSDQVTAHGHPVPEAYLGELKDSSALIEDGAILRARIAEDGYLFLRGVLDRNAVLAARENVFSKLVAVGEIREPAIDAITSCTSQRAEMVDDLGAFWQSICEDPAIRNVTHAGPIVTIMKRILDTTVRSYDFLWMRPTHPGRASAYHFDHVYMNRGTDQLYTVWTPIGDVALDEGPLALVEGSHRWDDLIDSYRGFDVDKDKSRAGHVTLDPVALVQERDTRLLTTAFKAGDVVIFPMFMLHGSLDNRSPIGRVRLSADTRYQPADAPIDERWVGANPIGHGQGYASMGGAQPATANPLFR